MLDQHECCHHMATVVCELGCSRAKVRGSYILMIFLLSGPALVSEACCEGS